MQSPPAVEKAIDYAQRVEAAEQEKARKASLEREAKERKKAEESGDPPALVAKRVKVYVCPTPGCSHYYGSSSMDLLEDVVVGQKSGNFEPRPESEWHSRAQCPSCRVKGLEVERVPVLMTVPAEAFAAASAA